jgi:hypothetical protein
MRILKGTNRVTQQPRTKKVISGTKQVAKEQICKRTVEKSGFCGKKVGRQTKQRLVHDIGSNLIS